MKTIPYGRQSIGRADIRAVTHALTAALITQGPVVEKFERALCRYSGAKYCIAVANGTAALHLAVAALGLRKGCSGITSPITFVASSNALIYNGIRPLFADIDGKTANISPEALVARMRTDTKVIIPVHFAGRPAEMKAIASIALKKKCFVIEDAAHAIGSRYPDGGRVGNCAHSDMTIFSFHPVKTITTGEGGAITTNHKDLYERLKRLRIHGITRDPSCLKQNPGPWYYEMQELGFNYRLTDFQAALGLSQLKKLGRFVARRRQIVAQYNKAFQDTPWLRPVSVNDSACAYHLYVVRIDFKQLGLSRNDLMRKLAKAGVGTQVHYIPVFRQPFYRQNFKFPMQYCPEAEMYYESCLSLPLFPAMLEKDVVRVIAAVLRLGKVRRRA